METGAREGGERAGRGGRTARATDNKEKSWPAAPAPLSHTPIHPSNPVAREYHPHPYRSLRKHTERSKAKKNLPPLPPPKTTMLVGSVARRAVSHLLASTSAPTGASIASARAAERWFSAAAEPEPVASSSESAGGECVCVVLVGLSLARAAYWCRTRTRDQAARRRRRPRRPRRSWSIDTLTRERRGETTTHRRCRRCSLRRAPPLTAPAHLLSPPSLNSTQVSTSRASTCAARRSTSTCRRPPRRTRASSTPCSPG